MNNDKIWFVHMLRGYAALFVFLSHVYFMFWTDNKSVSMILNTPTVDHIPLIISYLNQHLVALKINLGALGVALFFLISGFVIPISLDKLTIKQFLIRRVFRIYPAYWVSVILLTFTTFILTKVYNSNTMLFGFKEWFANALLINGYMNIISIDGINWTLSIELLFYLVLAVFSFKLKTSNFFHLLALITALLCGGIILRGGVIGYSVTYLTYMVIGTIFYNMFAVNTTRSQAVILMVISLASFLVLVNNNRLFASVKTIVVHNSLYAVVIFALTYSFRNQIKNNRLMDFLSNISYSLYLVHGFNSYIFMSILYQYTNSFLLCVFLSSTISIGVSYYMHKHIEEPCIRYSKKYR